MKIGPVMIRWNSKKRQILNVLGGSKIKAITKTKELYGWNLKKSVDYVRKLEEKKNP